MPISVKSTDLSFFQNYKMNPSDKSMDEFEHSSSSANSTNIGQSSISSATINANFSIKITVLVLLCFQNSGHALLTRYSRGLLKEEYSSTEVVLVGEIFKMFVSGYFTMTDRSDSDAQGVGYRKLLWLTWNSQKIVLLVFFYALSNLLAYYALARVDASAYTVLLQLKILTTAGFAGCILDRYISSSKWRALILLVIGCILVASPTYNNGNDCEHIDNNNNKRSLTALEVDSLQRTGPYLRGLLHDAQDTNGVSLLETMLGFGSILVMNTLSGFSSIYFESMLKKTGERITIWERNFQLAFYSIWLLLGILIWDLSSNPTANTFQLFKGWTMLAWVIAFVQAGGGLLVAATLKYADSILKTLATSGSIVMSAVLGYLLLGGQLDAFIVIGCITTILAIINYTFD